MPRIWNPTTLAPPKGAYSQCAEIQAGERIVHLAGQIGVDTKGKLAIGIEKQAEWALKNLRAALRANKMGLENITKMTIYATRHDFIPGYRSARMKIMGDIHPPNTYLIVSGLAQPEWLIEIDAFAAKP
jgi:2-iminobutanoate/2-iminopropanoate deaminase